MAKKNVFSNIVNAFFKKILSVPENHSRELGNPQKIIIIRQHNQLGDLLAGVPLFRAIKEKYPQSKITLVLSPVNYQGLTKNKYIDRIFIFDKKKLYNPSYFNDFNKLIRENYDIALVPVVVSVSFTSNLIAGLTNAKIKIGPASLDGRINESSYFFDRRIDVDWRKQPDSNVSERSLDIIRPFGITTNNYRSEITFDEHDAAEADKFISTLNKQPGEFLIGLHAGAGKAQNRWSLDKYVELINRVHENFPSRFYLTGSNT
ncbi:MAG: glycosyltransferase family 9 protein, partial [Ignavibacteriaceae bacterium]